ncbi:hypothetical protein J6590_018721 [Homalodisca vitripennis]|nr:hypothetical protein J6590_018721 [Homalodisca vitripennis]
MRDTRPIGELTVQQPVSRRRRASRQTRVQPTSWELGTVVSRIISCHLPSGRELVGAGLFWGEVLGDVILQFNITVTLHIDMYLVLKLFLGVSSLDSWSGTVNRREPACSGTIC